MSVCRRVAAVVLLSVLAACSGGSGDGDGLGPGPDSVVFVIRNSAGQPIGGATVYLVPAGQVDTSAFDGSDILSGAAADRDEPLEDAVRLNGATFPRGVTAANGAVQIQSVPAGPYFWFVQPAATDSEHLPGGSGSTIARDSSNFLGLQMDVQLSSSPGPAATYRGSSTCLVCHGDKAMISQHAHSLAITEPGQFSANQDAARYPMLDDGWARFLPAAGFMGGTPVFASDYDPARGADKFKTRLAAKPGETQFLTAWLWRDTADNRFKITLQNVINPADPRSPMTLVVRLTYGAGVFRQRNLVAVQGRRGLYPLLQFQVEGAESRFDRTRLVYRDYHLDWFWNAGTQTLTDPPVSGTWDGNCTGCHATGFTRFQDPLTQEWLFDAVEDAGGAYDVEGNGTRDDVNVGCESCHGPGSEHVTWAADPANAGRQARFIVSPRRLSPERQMLICGRCHDTPQGNGPTMNQEPLDGSSRFPRPGIGRAEYLAGFTSRDGPELSDYWSDELFSKRHRQQYSDLVKSGMHRNARILTVCSDCHGSHGDGEFEHQLNENPQDPNTRLCQQCHAIDILSHMMAKTGSTHAGNNTLCVRCHMPQTARAGAGHYGIQLGVPNGTATDENIAYYENDVASHTFRVPRKNHPDVAGELPSRSMPIPYTNGCGSPCHDPSPLPNLPLLLTGPALWGSTSELPDARGKVGGGPPEGQ